MTILISPTVEKMIKQIESNMEKEFNLSHVYIPETGKYLRVKTSNDKK
jgi:hypothetical protein